jgi:hypothetical protein
MKTVLAFVFTLFGLFLLISCQEEENTIVQDTTQNLNKTSPATKFLSRVAQNNTSIDNVVDGTSVFRVKLPVQITLNSVNVTLNTVADYQVVSDLKAASTSDDDVVNYAFPITVSLRNFQEVIVNNTAQLTSIISQNDDFSDISCVSIVYPITINVYDSNNQVADILTFNSNSQLIGFLFSLQPNVFYSVNYPISIVNPSNQTVVINTNAELVSAIESAISQCGSNSGSDDEFLEVLTSGSWRVSYYFDDEDETDDFNGYVFAFSANNTIQVVKNSTSYTGTWSFYEDDGVDVFDIQFDDPILNELSDDWDLREFSSTLIQLKDDSNDEYLNFSKL